MNASYRQCVNVLVFAIGLVALPQDAGANAGRARTLTVYDTGFAWVEETREVSLQKGIQEIRMEGLPRGVDPGSVSLLPGPDAPGLSVLGHSLRDDLASDQALFERFVGQPVRVRSDGAFVEGELVGVTVPRTGGKPLLVIRPEATEDVVRVDAATIEKAFLPEERVELFDEPTLIWKLKADTAGPRAVRLRYALPGISWSAHYDLHLLPIGSTARIFGRISLSNRTPNTFENARVELKTTPLGRERPHLARLPVSSASIASRERPRRGDAAGEQGTPAAEAAAIPLEDPVNLAPRSTTFIGLFPGATVPVTRYHVYDGYLPDRFDRNPRTDWEMGTRSTEVIETVVSPDPLALAQLESPLPPGDLHVFSADREGFLDWLGKVRFQWQDDATPIPIMPGISRNMRAERERSGYVEIVPLEEYEESFEIRLFNDSDRDAEIRVTEHLYRGENYEIVKSDTEYEPTGPQTIEFRPVLKAGGKRSIHYTVRYSW